MGKLRTRKALRGLRAKMAMSWGLEGKAGGKEAERSREVCQAAGRTQGGQAKVRGLACALRIGRETSPETAGGGGGMCVCVSAVTQSRCLLSSLWGAEQKPNLTPAVCPETRDASGGRASELPSCLMGDAEGQLLPVRPQVPWRCCRGSSLPPRHPRHPHTQPEALTPVRTPHPSPHLCYAPGTPMSQIRCLCFFLATQNLLKDLISI